MLLQVIRQSDETFSSILTLIGNGENLSEDHIGVIESRFRTEAWCNTNLRDAVRLFHTNASVDSYHRSVVITEEHSVATDSYSGYRDQRQLTAARGEVHKYSSTKTANLAYDLPLAIGYPYMITANIDLDDGLVNGAMGYLRYIEFKPEGASTTELDDGDSRINCLWVEFSDNNRTGQLTRSKCRPKVVASAHLDSSWTPIYRRKATFSIIGMKSVKCRRINFPLSLACAMTAHKSQGATFDKVVFDYHKKLTQQLVYVALSRVKTLDGLYLTNCTNDTKFYHGRPLLAPKLIQLQTELQRLEAHPLVTLDHQHLTRLENVAGIVLNFNVQSLPAHVLDITTDEVLMKAEVFCFTETWLENGIAFEIDRLRLLAQNKRPGRRGGVAIFQRNSATAMFTSIDQPPLSESDEGDICAVMLLLGGQQTMIVSVYINPNTSFERMKNFLEKQSVLLAESSRTSLPALIVCGDFNYNVKDEAKRNMFLSFMQEAFGLSLAIDPLISTTNHHTCLDLIFARNVNIRDSFSHVSYFSYHMPVFLTLSPKSMVPYGSMELA